VALEVGDAPQGIVQSDQHVAVTEQDDPVRLRVAEPTERLPEVADRGLRGRRSVAEESRMAYGIGFDPVEVGARPGCPPSVLVHIHALRLPVHEPPEKEAVEHVHPRGCVIVVVVVVTLGASLTRQRRLRGHTKEQGTLVDLILDAQG
jgi:hypothetical protein